VARSRATIVGDRRVQTLLMQMADRARGVEAHAWASVGDVIAAAMTKQFDTEGSFLNGRQWAPLSPRYLGWKVARGLDPRRLHATGDMRASLTGRPMAIEEYSDHRGRFGTNDEKAGFHQSGTSQMPARVIINVTEDLADDVNSALARYIFDERL